MTVFRMLFSSAKLMYRMYMSSEKGVATTAFDEQDVRKTTPPCETRRDQEIERERDTHTFREGKLPMFQNVLVFAAGAGTRSCTCDTV